MRHFTSFSRQLLLTVPLALSPLAAAAQDPAQVSPEVYTATIDNKDVRVLDIQLKAGGKSPMHSHPGYLVIALTPCKVRFTSPEGKTTEAELKAGDVAWRDAESHTAENIGTADCHAINVEMKQAAVETGKAK